MDSLHFFSWRVVQGSCSASVSAAGLVSGNPFSSNTCHKETLDKLGMKFLNTSLQEEQARIRVGFPADSTVFSMFLMISSLV